MLKPSIIIIEILAEGAQTSFQNGAPKTAFSANHRKAQHLIAHHQSNAKHQFENQSELTYKMAAGLMFQRGSLVVCPNPYLNSDPTNQTPLLIICQLAFDFMSFCSC